jgi:hypothetical protein
LVRGADDVNAMAAEPREERSKVDEAGHRILANVR